MIDDKKNVSSLNSKNKNNTNKATNPNKKWLSNRNIGIIVGVSVLIIAGIIVGVVFTLRKKKPPTSTVSTSDAPNTTDESTVQPIIPQSTPDTLPVLSTDRKEVYSVDSNSFKYEEAPYVCKVLGGELATYEQLVESAKTGSNWCNMGWFKEQYIPDKKGTFNSGYPVQKKYYEELKSLPIKEEKKNMCGKKWQPIKEDATYSIQNMSNLPHGSLRGVNCYGVKDAFGKIDKEHNKPEDLVDENKTKKKIEQKLEDIPEWKGRNPFNDKKWSKYS